MNWKAAATTITKFKIASNKMPQKYKIHTNTDVRILSTPLPLHRGHVRKDRGIQVVETCCRAWPSRGRPVGEPKSRFNPQLLPDWGVPAFLTKPFYVEGCMCYIIVVITVRFVVGLVVFVEISGVANQYWYFIIVINFIIMFTFYWYYFYNLWYYYCYQHEYQLQYYHYHHYYIFYHYDFDISL